MNRFDPVAEVSIDVNRSTPVDRGRRSAVGQWEEKALRGGRRAIGIDLKERSNDFDKS